MRIFTPEKLDALKTRKIHIVGVAGTEGFAVLEYLLKIGCQQITGHNLSGGDDLIKAFNAAHVAIPKSDRPAAIQRLLNGLSTLRTGSDYLSDIEDADMIFATQNWFAHAANIPIKNAREKGVPVHFLTQLYFDLSPATIIAVTGTNGKTTVTSLIDHIFNVSQAPALMSGNDRYHAQSLPVLDKLDANGALILEVSNRQLLELHRGPDISVMTSLRPDHVDEHGSFENYLQAKRRLFLLTPETGTAILNRSDPYYHSIREGLNCTVLTYGLDVPSAENTWGLHGQQIVRLINGSPEFVLPIADIPLHGDHNLLNVMAAMAASTQFGLDIECVAKAVRQFRGVKHRTECLGTVNGSQFIDDIASTNPAATRAAIDGLREPAVLICGGDLKGNADDYTILTDSLNRKIHHIVALPGKASDLICGLPANVPVHRVDTLDAAMKIADQLLEPGVHLLLSPAGAGFQTRFNSGPRGFRRHFRERQRAARKKNSSSWTPTDLTRFVSVDTGRCYLKHEYQCPTGSHKDRAAQFQIAQAVKHRAEAVIIPSSGNAALAVSAAGKACGLPVYAFLSHGTHPGKLRAMQRHTPRIVLTDKPVNRARNAARRFGFPNLRPSRDPDAITGFMSLGFELAVQDADESITDLFIFCTSGASLMGISLAFDQLQSNGKRTIRPKLHAVQTGTASELARHFDSRNSSQAVNDSQKAGFGGVAGSRLVKPLIDQITLSGGSGWLMRQDEIDNAALILTQHGISTSAEGQAAMAAVIRWRQQGGEGEPVVVLTGRRYAEDSAPFNAIDSSICRSDLYGDIDAFIRRWHTVKS